MAEFKARTQQKRDTSANWTKANPIILDGEIIIVETESGEIRMKVGDGKKTYTQLPFDDEAVRSLINERISVTQGAENAGKILGIDQNGRVAPVAVSVDGDGNAVTDISYDAENQTLKITKGEAFVTPDEIKTSVDNALREAKESGAFKGDKGDKGDDGAPGTPGLPGADGKTPVKGTDYFTDADVEEIVGKVLENFVDVSVEGQ